jgi:hypothetical protein
MSGRSADVAIAIAIRCGRKSAHPAEKRRVQTHDSHPNTAMIPMRANAISKSPRMRSLLGDRVRIAQAAGGTIARIQNPCIAANACNGGKHPHGPQNEWI